MGESQRGAFCVLYMHFLSVVRVWWWGGLYKGVTQKIMHSDWAAIWKEKFFKIIYTKLDANGLFFNLLQWEHGLWRQKLLLMFQICCYIFLCCAPCVYVVWCACSACCDTEPSRCALPLVPPLSFALSRSPSRPPSIFPSIAHCLGGRWCVYAAQGIYWKRSTLFSATTQREEILRVKEIVVLS